MAEIEINGRRVGDAVMAPGWSDDQERTSTGLIRPPTIFGDWLALDAVTPNQAPVPSDLIGTAYFA